MLMIFLYYCISYIIYAALHSVSGTKKAKHSAASPLTRRPGNQGSFSSVRVNTLSAAAADLLGISNITNASAVFSINHNWLARVFELL